MNKDYPNKIKMLKLYELLKSRTDKDNPLLASEISAGLEEMGVHCCNKNIHGEIKLLNHWGYNIKFKNLNSHRAYYFDDRLFSGSENRLMISALQSSKFASEGNTRALIQKIANSAGPCGNNLLRTDVSVICPNSRKRDCDAMFGNFNVIEDAILQNKKLIFKYYDIDGLGERVYRCDGQYLVVEPIKIIFIDDNYYLIACNGEQSDTVNYRIDKMDCLNSIDNHISQHTAKIKETIKNHPQLASDIYGKPEIEIKLRFHGDIAEAVFDEFGYNISTTKISENIYEAKVKSYENIRLWGWLLEQGKRAEIIYPASLREKYNTKLADSIVKSE